MILKIGKARIAFWWAGITKEKARKIISAINNITEIKSFDDKRLLWELIQCGVFDGLNPLTREDFLRDELETRMFPEYDGENVTFEEWGWHVQGGNDIVYYPKRKSQMERTQ
jgi:hypothetical protein